METIKSYTDLEQSKKLAEILPVESADMYYFDDNGGEPKFKAGDWVIDKQGLVHQIANVIENVTYHTYGYDIVGGGYFNDNTEGVRLWTIQDARDGDVLEFGDHGRLVTGILSFVNKTTGKVDVSCLLEGDKFKVGVFYNLDTVKPHPATKEQRDLLFKKMKEAGYEWDAKNKELKKSEGEPTWSVEDETMLRKAIITIDNVRMDTNFQEYYQGICDWLESLRDRVQPQQEWSEEDLTKLKSAITLLEHPVVISDNTGIQEKTIDFLKSLKDKVQLQSHWKPSEGQMKALGNCVCKTWFDKDMLKTLYNDLQNL